MYAAVPKRKGNASRGLLALSVTDGLSLQSCISMVTRNCEVRVKDRKPTINATMAVLMSHDVGLAMTKLAINIAPAIISVLTRLSMIKSGVWAISFMIYPSILLIDWGFSSRLPSIVGNSWAMSTMPKRDTHWTPPTPISFQPSQL